MAKNHLSFLKENEWLKGKNEKKNEVGFFHLTLGITYSHPHCYCLEACRRGPENSTYSYIAWKYTPKTKILEESCHKNYDHNHYI